MAKAQSAGTVVVRASKVMKAGMEARDWKKIE